MSRTPHPPSTALGIALRERRAGQSQIDAGQELGIPHSTLSRIERGTHRPSVDTARALAAWLGWSLEQVLHAAEQPAPVDGSAP